MEKERAGGVTAGKAKSGPGKADERSAASIVDLQDVNEAKEELSLRCINEEEKSLVEDGMRGGVGRLYIRSRDGWVWWDEWDRRHCTALSQSVPLLYYWTSYGLC